MTKKEIRRAGVLERVKASEMNLVEAASALGVSYRQVKRLNRKYRKRGVKGLVHGNTGRRSNNATDGKTKRRVLALIRRHYSGDPDERFGPTLAAEHLSEDHAIDIDAETLRRWMLAAGLWSRERKSKTYRKRRARRKHFGEMVQMDGSFEDWLEKRAERACLINMVDDATTEGLALFAAEETTWAVADTLRAWVEKYGIPRALYVDWKNVYHHAPTDRQVREGEEAISEFQRMCGKLGIAVIGANSPQAKGRVERSHGVHQDRLIKKMRLKDIRTYEEANRFLRETYLPQHNGRYAITAAEKVDFHEPVPKGLDLDEVFCLETERTVSNDWVVQYAKRWLQIEQEAGVKAGSKVLIRERRDGSLRIVQNEARVAWHELEGRPSKPAVVSKAAQPKRTAPPPSDHPWRQTVLNRKA